MEKVNLLKQSENEFRFFLDGLLVLIANFNEFPGEVIILLKWVKGMKIMEGIECLLTFIFGNLMDSFT